MVSLGVRDGVGIVRWGAAGGAINGVLERPLDVAAGGAPNMSQRSSSPTLEFSGTAASSDGVLLPPDDPIRGGGASTGMSLGKGLLFSIASNASNSVKPLPPSSKLFSVVSGTESAKNSRSEAESETDSDTASRARSDSTGFDLEKRLKNRDTPETAGSAGAGEG